ncbi:685_t:CDS:2 [Acaulospora colombiana]|uniref:685_t:CDS:1 n=1 Tax=Acaulospora colombiana TaxID=27376 RepID=A0ACA9L0Z2_9GLOM|nr:685_t:CDS:2 [Acaulospora colombiana]
MEQTTNVILFGATGCGKSTIANMLYKGKIYENDNEFEINDGGKGCTPDVTFKFNEEFGIFDTVGLGEPKGATILVKAWITPKYLKQLLTITIDFSEVLNDDESLLQSPVFDVK